MSAFYNKPIFTLFANLSAIGAATYFNTKNLTFNYEESEARFDELEGTLRGHIGMIEDALDRLEGKKKEGEGSKMYVWLLFTREWK